MTTEVLSRRHPGFLEKGSRYATAAEAYQPPATLATGKLQGLLWGVRTSFEELQYMVYNEDCTEVLASGRTPEIAALSAHRRLEREERLPQSYEPRLMGCTFAKGVEPGSNFILHSVVSPTGEVLGASEDGRDQACEIASRALIQRVDAEGVTFEEFAGICHVIKVERTRMRGHPWALFDDEDGRARLRKQLAEIWRADPRAREVGESGGLLQGNPSLDKFIRGAETTLLDAAAKMGGQVSCIRLGFCGDERQVYLNFSSAARLSSLDIKRTVYDAYCEELQERRESHRQRVREA